MKRSMLVLAMLMCGGAFAQTTPPPGAGQGPGPGPGMGRGGGMMMQEKQIGQEITSAVEGFESAWNRHDVKAMTAHFADDARLVTPFGEQADGRAQINALIQKEQSTAFRSSHVDLTTDRVRLLTPTYAFVDASMKVHGMLRPDGSMAPDLNVHALFLMTRRAGSWQFLDARPHVYAPMPRAAVGGAGEAGMEHDPMATPPVPRPPPTPTEPGPKMGP